MTSYIYETLPSPVVGTFGQTVSLSTILSQEFGPKYGGYTDFYVSCFGWQALDQFDPPLGYWNDTTQTYGTIAVGTMTQWLENGNAVGLADFKQQPSGMWPVQVDDPTSGAVHVDASNLGQFSLQIGSNIAPFAFISVPVAFDSSHNPTEFVQYSITTTDPSLYAPTSAPAPEDVYDAAFRYALKYQNVDNLDDCHLIAQDVASAAGAALDDPTESTDPTKNVSAGFWRVVYRGSDPNPVSNWSMTVEAGDIVRVGWASGGAHTFTVVDVGFGTVQGSDGLDHKDLTVYDNGLPDNQGIPGIATSFIGIHDDFVGGKWYDEWSDPKQVTIYRLSPDAQYLIDESQLGGDNPNLGARLVGTANGDHIIGGSGDNTISSWTGNDLIDGGGGTNTLDYSWDNQGITADLLAGTVSKGAGNGTDQFSHIQKFIGSSAGGDVFYVGAGSFSFDGGSGFGKTLDYSSDQNFFHITVDLTQQTVTKTILGYSQTDNFSYIDTFIGTVGNDTFKSILWGAFSFDGNAGHSNTLDYSELTSSVSFNIQYESGTVDKAPDPSWKGMTDSFFDIQDFTGGAGDDKFKIGPDTYEYILNGGDGSDALDYSAFTTGVTFDLQQHVVHKNSPPVQVQPGVPIYKSLPLTDHFSSMEAFNGGSGDDTLIDGPGTTKQFFDGGGGNDTVVLSGNYNDYAISTGFNANIIWHTTVNPVTSTDAPLDLMNVEQLKFGDGSTLQLASHGYVFPASSLSGVAQNGAITKYQFWDSTTDPASGRFVVDGLVQAKSQAIDVSAAQLGQTTFQSGSGSNDLWVRTFDGVQWSAWKEFRVMAPINHAPVIVASDQTVAHGANLAASSLFSIGDADGDAMTRYQFWDSTADPLSGHFVVNGAAQGAGQTIEVSAAQLGQTTFHSGSGADDLWVRAFDGMDWSAWKEFHVNAPVDPGPVVTTASVTLSKDQSAIAASSLFAARAPFRDPIATYAFWDTGAAGGHFLIDGVAQATSTEIDVAAAQLSQLTYQPGAGGDTLWVRANDGYVWGAWSQAFTVNPWVDSAPAVTVSNARAVHGESFAASSLFGVSDADGDAITKYAFWDTGSGGGHFSLNGVAQGTNQEIDITAAQLSQLSYQPGSGADTLWVRANDGMQWSGWSSSFTVTAPIDTGPVVTPTNASIRSFPNQTFAASSLIGYSDPFNSPATQYDVWNSGGGGGHFLLNGRALAANQDNFISATQLGQLSYQVGTGSDTLWARANDGTVWGGWSKSFTISDPPAVADGETITLGSAYAGKVDFLSDTGTLKLEDSSSFAGTVAGLHGQDAIDLADIGFGANSTLGYAANADHSGGTLSVGNGMHMANIALLGSYMASTFAAASDGHGGTLISEAAQTSAQTPLMTQPHA